MKEKVGIPMVTKSSNDFQTPDWVCQLMVDMLENFVPPGRQASEVEWDILEPTPGRGNLVKILKERFPRSNITATHDFWALPNGYYDAIIANPPFTPMPDLYKMLYRFRELSWSIIALMPWLTLINSDKRTNWLLKSGLNEVVHLPRSVFTACRIQPCIMKLSPGAWPNNLNNIKFRIAQKPEIDNE